MYVDGMFWLVALGVAGLFVALCLLTAKRHERDPIVMPFQTGHHGGLGEAPPSVHHRLGARKP